MNNNNQPKPQVIFLDAVGTLFGIRGTVGEIYGKIAAQRGVKVSSEHLNQAFLKTFQASSPLAFSEAELSQIPNLEFKWWQKIAHRTFTEAGVIDQFSDFNSFFVQLYEHFSLKDPWFVYTDVVPALTIWQEQGIELGIISNFDSRLYQVLELLELRIFFRSITISSMTGTAKPNQAIFATALQKHNCLPQQAWHVGDSLKEDYYGAKKIGIRPFLIQRSVAVFN